MLTLAKKILPIAMGTLLTASFANADPFEDCPVKAFLIQGKIAKVYGVNLATGHYEVLKNGIDTGERFNGVGFSVHDNFIYGWDYRNQTLSRMHSDFSLEPLEIQNKPGKTFFVGDVSLASNTYYGYRRSDNQGDYGLYSVSLDPDSPDYLDMQNIVDGRTLNLRVFDIAFHPTDSFAYTVDRDGILYRLDVTAGAATNLGYVGADANQNDLKGTYGAVYFDVDGNFYISRNQDGQIFRINVSAAEPKAQFFASGPSSSTNDGARCANAAVAPPPTLEIDYGDAPESYGTFFDNGDNPAGASHQITGNTLFLGVNRDSESDGYPYPLSDDTTGDNDDDGVQFITSLTSGELAFVEVTSSEAANLSAWADFNQNGTFDEGEAIFSSQSVVAGQNILSFTVPDTAEAGDTWLRFRLSSANTLQPTGGAPDGEVEDYMMTVLEGAAVENDFYPSKQGYTTLVYEDNWPQVGDYDLNDLVVYYRSEEIHSNDEVQSVRITGDIAAIGADYKSGFAIRLKGIDPENVNENTIMLRINDIQVDSARELVSVGGHLLEQGRTEAIFDITDNIKNWTNGEQEAPCYFYRTVRDCPMPLSVHFELSFEFNEPVADADMPEPPYDPFLFATPNASRGDLFLEPPGRGLEIHLQGQGVTEAFDDSLWGMADDASDPGNAQWFVTNKGMPWAFELQTYWKYPVEFVDVIWAYPGFVNFVESGGTENLDWYSPLKAWEPNIYPY